MSFTVLLIEDVADSATLVQRFLSPLGYNVLWARTAEEGVQMVVDNRPNVILLDLGLPDMDGKTLVGYLRTMPDVANIPIVVVTAWPEETAKRMVTQYGCDSYLCKPIEAEKLLALLNRYLPKTRELRYQSP